MLIHVELIVLFLIANAKAIIRDSSGNDTLTEETLKILGGKEATPHSRPWIGQLFHNGEFHCGCSLISNRYALTAAHCTKYDSDPEHYHIVFGGHRLKSGNSFLVERIIEHPKYRRFSSSLSYDAALLLLDEVVSETDKISTIRLADRSPDENETCIVNGWGSTKDRYSPSSKVLMEATIHTLPSHNCNRSVFFDKNIMICANESFLAGSCAGDSGGPMLCSNNRAYYEQHGIVSFGLYSTCRVGPGVYTDVSKILPWIRSQVNFTQSTDSTPTLEPESETTTTTLQPEHSTMPQPLITDSTNITPELINQTLRNFDQESFDQLISKVGTNWTNQYQESLLHIAAIYGYFNASEALIKKNPQLVNATDKYHNTPLYKSTWHGHCNIVSLLLNNSADVNDLANFTDDTSKYPSMSLLYWAARNGHDQCVQILLNHGAKINHKTRAGWTALHIASLMNYFQVVKKLVEGGADTSIKTNLGSTALEIAIRNKVDQRIIRCLETKVC